MGRKALVFAKKLLIFLAGLLLLSLAVFCVSRLAPGDALTAYYGERAEKMSPRERADAEARLGLDRPLAVQYVRWLSGALRGQFGISFKYKTDVLSLIRSRLGNTLLLGGAGFALIFILAPALGILCVRFEGRWPDRLICRLGAVSGCIPEFWLSLLLIALFSVTLRVLPGSGAYCVGKSGDMADRLEHLVLPLAVVVLSHLWYYAYPVRSRLIDEVRRDYILLAKSQGLSRGRILFRHCLRNILPSYLSLMAVSVPHILGGTYIVEAVFSYPGLGTLSYESARYKDYNLLMLLCILSGAAVMLCGALAQAVSRRLDPRMRDDAPPGEARDDG